MYSLPSSLHDFQLYLACCILVLRITGRLSLLIPHTHKRETSLVAQMVKSRLQCRRPRFEPWVRKIPWRRKWQSTPVFLPGESHGWRSLVSYSPRGCKESDTIEQLHFHFSRCKEEPTCQCRRLKRCGVSPWIGKIP